jgi:purine nucleoside phosphorylase
VSEIALGRLRGWGADIAIILGSGLNALAQEAPAESAISYSEFSELPKTSVPGHADRFVLKQMHGKSIVYHKDASISTKDIQCRMCRPE